MNTEIENNAAVRTHVDEVVNHIVEVGLLDASANYTYENGLDKGARLMLAYLMKYGILSASAVENM